MMIGDRILNFRFQIYDFAPNRKSEIVNANYK